MDLHCGTSSYSVQLLLVAFEKKSSKFLETHRKTDTILAFSSEGLT